MITDKSLRCIKCICTSTTPGVTIDNDGLCSECKNDKLEEYNNHEYIDEMEQRFDAVRKKDIPYHAMCMFSGGKDSSYLLYMLKEKYHLRPLAFSVIHPFVNETAIANMERVAEKLGVDLIKFHLNEEIRKKLIRQSILEKEKYNFEEDIGCGVCSRLFHRISMKMAIQLNIPYILVGNDPTQSPAPVLVDGEKIKDLCMKGESYIAQDRKLYEDVLGNEYKGSIYFPDFELYKKNDFPTRICPFTFMDYDSKTIWNELEKNDILSKEESSSSITNCDAQHLFTYLSFKWYDCDNAVKFVSRGIRWSKPTVFNQLGRSSRSYTREDYITFFEEYRNMLFYIAENPGLSLEEYKKALAPQVTYLISSFGEDIVFSTIGQMSKIHFYADYLNVSL